MKKTIKLLSMVLVIAMIAVLSLSLVACNKNKDKIETTTVDQSKIDEIFTSVFNNTKTADNFRYQYKCDELEYDVYVMKVLYGTSDVGMAKATIKDYFFDGQKDTLATKEILFGDYNVLEDGEKHFAHDTKACYELQNDAWVDSLLFESVEDLHVYESLANIENYTLRNVESAYSFATCEMTQTTKNGAFQSYDGTVVLNDLTSYTFKIVEYQGKLVLASLCGSVKFDVESKQTTTYTHTYTYGTTFEIPVVELDK